MANVAPAATVLLVEDDPSITIGLRMNLEAEGYRVLIEAVWGVIDDVATVGYAHDVAEAIEAAVSGGRTAVLVRATPVAAVAEVAAAGARMPRKSTLFTPKLEKLASFPVRSVAPTETTLARSKSAG